MKTWNERERLALADKLDSIGDWLSAVPDMSEEVQDVLREALDDAITLIAPGYFDRLAKEFEAGMNDPEIQKLVEETMRLPRAQEFIADVERVKRGEMTVEELEKKIHGAEV